MEPETNPVADVPGLALEEHLTIVRIGGDLRSRLLATLEGAGWRLVTDDALPSPDPGFFGLDSIEDVERQLSVSRQAAELAESELAAALAEMSALGDDVEKFERLRAELDGLADLIDGELAEPRHVTDSTERLTRMAEGAQGLGFDRFAPALSSWVAEIAAGTAAPDPDAVALMARRAEINRELDGGAGSVDRAPDVLAAHARRHELRSLSVELEGMVERGLTPESRQLIESAHAERGRTEDAGGRRGAGATRDAVAAEEAALARFGYSSFLDFQISTSTRSVGEHAEMTLVRVRADLEQAEGDLAAATQAAVSARTKLQAELETVNDAIGALAGDRSIDGMLARPAVLEELRDQVREAGDAALASSGERRDRQNQCQPVVDRLTQEVAAAEAEVEALVASRHELSLAWDVAEAAIDQGEQQLRDLLTEWVAEGPLAVEADVAWLTAERLTVVFEAAAEAGPVVWCTDRSDIGSARALDGPSRWWQFRRRARHGALIG